MLVDDALDALERAQQTLSRLLIPITDTTDVTEEELVRCLAGVATDHRSDATATVEPILQALVLGKARIAALRA
ncbi:hypothetical protein [Streptomyces sp. DH12]|uniref:hypothetical protein n=1 Tax=Streptomyces sp. DH12 TaxID=2857010 RepID=UPI001E628758|nr:hypothetical protein [Streptomyces sp. DH12]